MTPLRLNPRQQPGTEAGRAQMLRRIAAALLALALGAPGVLHAGALVQAAKYGNVEAALALIDDGADVGERGHAGETALHWAAFNGQLDVARRLIAGGAPVNAQVKNGNTPLHQAAYAGHLAIVRMLLVAGANANALDARGATPAGWAERNGHQTVVRALREHAGRVDLGSNAHQPTRAEDRASNAYSGQFDPRYNAGLSRRMGELPSVVLRVPSNVAATAPTLSLTRDIDFQPTTRAAAIPDIERADSRQVWVQLGAFRRERDAGVHRDRLLARYRDLLADQPLKVVAAEVEGRGRFHRVRVGPLGVSHAQRTCSALKARGAKCLLIFSHR